MPASGKTTVGKALATKLDFTFMDLDSMVEEKEGISLIDVMNTKGADYFRNMEYSFINDISPDTKVVISPAGSIIFQLDAMKWIKENSTVVFLDTPFEMIEKLLSQNPKAVAGLTERGLKSIWDERIPIYKRYADHTLETKDTLIDQIVNDICNLF